MKHARILQAAGTSAQASPDPLGHGRGVELGQGGRLVGRWRRHDPRPEGIARAEAAGAGAARLARLRRATCNLYSERSCIVPDALQLSARSALRLRQARALLPRT